MTIQFEVLTPLDDAALVHHVRHALELGYPDAAWRGCRIRSRLKVIANGPTARLAPLEGGNTLALNGALRLFTEQGLAPTFWAACDPLPMVADFLRDAPTETTYLVASKCHPSVFEALRGRDVRLWHVDDFCTWPLLERRDPVRTATTITLTIFELMHRLGFRQFETWGWDGCYIDGQDHAVPQVHERPPQRIDVGGQIFDSTPSWALEAEDAVNKIRTWTHPSRLTVHGGGMIGAILSMLVPGVRAL